MKLPKKYIKFGFLIVILLFCCVALSLFAEWYFPYEEITEVDNFENWQIHQLISFIALLPIGLFVLWFGFLLGWVRYAELAEESSEKIQD